MSTLIIDELFNGVIFSQDIRISKSVNLEWIRPWIYKQGDLNIQGQRAATGGDNQFGGSSELGYGANQTSIVALNSVIAGVAGQLYGGGACGSSAKENGSNQTQAGSVGADGLVIVENYIA
jgi:hypothetical protein